MGFRCYFFLLLNRKYVILRLLIFFLFCSFVILYICNGEIVEEILKFFKYSNWSILMELLDIIKKINLEVI